MKAHHSLWLGALLALCTCRAVVAGQSTPSSTTYLCPQDSRESNSTLRALYDPTEGDGACFSNCTRGYCACLGPAYYEYSESESLCVPIAPSSGASGRRSSSNDNDACAIIDDCIRSFTVCVAMEALQLRQQQKNSAAAVGGLAAPCGEWASFLSTVLIEYVNSSSNTTRYQSTPLFTACRDYTCNAFANYSAVVGADCQPYPELDCPAALAPASAYSGPPPPPAVLLLTGPDGEPLVPASEITGRLRIAGDFSTFVSPSSSKYDEMASAVGKSIKSLTGGYPVTIANMSSGSLVVSFALKVPTSVLSTVTTQLQSAVTNPRSDWLASVQAAYNVYYPNVILSPAVVMSLTVRSILSGTSISGVPSSGAACGSGCVAGVIIGSVAFVAVVGFVLAAWCRGPTGQKLRASI